MKIVIVGGVAGGATAAARLRRLDENAQIIMLERGEFISFANCGLPYYIGGEIKEKERLTVMTPESFKSKFNVDVRTFSEAVSIDRANKIITVKKVKTGEIYQESYDKMVLSPGAEPIVPPIEGIKSDRVFVLRNIPDTYRIKDFIENQTPKKAFVVGGGFIGVELAENLVKAGIDVTLAELADQILPPLDFDMVADVQNHMRAKGVKLLFGAGLERIVQKPGGLEISAGGNLYEADFAVLAIGVKPDSRLASESGIECNKRGGIKADKYMRTSDPDIYAAGDAVEITDFVTGQPAMIPLAGPANKQGRIAADNICGLKSEYKGSQGSSILKVFDLTVAATGISEKTARRLGLDYEKSFTYSANHAGYYPGAVNMSVKTIFDKKTGRILGAQLVGYDGTDKRADVFATAIRAGMTAHDLTELELCYAPPYSSAKDPVNMAGYVIENIMEGREKIYHWHDVEELSKRSDVTLLDTRTAAEYENGHIDNYINIPVDELRSRIGELDKGKPVYVTCQIGLRGYIAARILVQNGFEAYNLSGGYRLYNSIYRKTLTAPSVRINTETQTEVKMEHHEVIRLDACGLQCPGPVVKLSEALKNAAIGQIVEISTTDPAFAGDVEGFCRRTGNEFLGMSENRGTITARIKKAAAAVDNGCKVITHGNNKNFIVFSGDLDKAIASFIMANAAAAMGRHVEMFFTFWGLNILRKREKTAVKKTFIEKMFGMMMPRGSLKLGLSRMNMGGMGTRMIRGIMKKKNISSLEELIALAQKNGVRLLACSMSMDVMGLRKEELIDGVEIAGAARMLANAEESDMSLFI
jgi:NADPH-dependent 2,4-dienoyl-CoA reductase/sulfur reductase-like enzyme/peroxiredoxin family protein/rhodanese-related sulfurtransferase/TusA-related sulfurtransferase